MLQRLLSRLLVAAMVAALLVPAVLIIVKPDPWLAAGLAAGATAAAVLWLGREALTGAVPVLGVVLFFRALLHDQLPVAVAFGAGALVTGVAGLLWRGPAVLPLLSIRYLFRRRIAYVAVLSVTLCTAMVLVVASIMEGFLNAARSAMRDARGDILLIGDYTGFAFYEDFVARVRSGHASLIDPKTGRPAVVRAVPLMSTQAMAHMPVGGSIRVQPVKVIGLLPADARDNDRFWRGYRPLGEKGDPAPLRFTREDVEAWLGETAKAGNPIAPEAAGKIRDMAVRPFRTREHAEIELFALFPEGNEAWDALRKRLLDRLRSDAVVRLNAAGLAYLLERSDPKAHDGLRALQGKAFADRAALKAAVAGACARAGVPVPEGGSGDHVDEGSSPRLGERYLRIGDKTMAGGGAVVGLEMVSMRDRKGGLHPVLETGRPIRLMLLPPADVGRLATEIAPPTVLFQAEGYHRSGVYDQDRETMFLDFGLLQQKLGMQADPENGKPGTCNAVQIDLDPDTSLEDGKQIVTAAWGVMIADVEAAQLARFKLSEAGTPPEKWPAPQAGPAWLLESRTFTLADGGREARFPAVESSRPEPTQIAIDADLPAGAKRIPLRNTAGFRVGGTVRLFGGGSPHEAAVVTAIEAGALVVRDPLQHSRKLDSDPRESPVIIAEERFGRVHAQTWEEGMRTFLVAVQKEKVMMLVLFGIISLVAVLLVLSIFIQIVKEKTRDIGILRSVGAGKGAVAGVFLLYAACIGTVGAAAGTILGWRIVHHINEIHDVIASLTGVVIWDPAIYVLPKIPNTVDGRDAGWVAGIGIVASLVAALVPAWLAARLPPVRALSYE